MSAPRVEFADLGTWGGARLLAEYDPQDDAIRIHATAVARVRAALGDDGARRFVACAIAHETYHRAHPNAPEAHAHAHARETTGADLASFERAARG